MVPEEAAKYKAKIKSVLPERREIDSALPAKQKIELANKIYKGEVDRLDLGKDLKKAMYEFASYKEVEKYTFKRRFNDHMYLPPRFLLYLYLKKGRKITLKDLERRLVDEPEDVGMIPTDIDDFARMWYSRPSTRNLCRRVLVNWLTLLGSRAKIRSNYAGTVTMDPLDPSKEEDPYEPRHWEAIFERVEEEYRREDLRERWMLLIKLALATGWRYGHLAMLPCSAYIAEGDLVEDVYGRMFHKIPLREELLVALKVWRDVEPGSPKREAPYIYLTTELYDELRSWCKKTGGEHRDHLMDVKEQTMRQFARKVRRHRSVRDSFVLYHTRRTWASAIMSAFDDLDFVKRQGGWDYKSDVPKVFYLSDLEPDKAEEIILKYGIYISDTPDHIRKKLEIPQRIELAREDRSRRERGRRIAAGEVVEEIGEEVKIVPSELDRIMNKLEEMDMKIEESRRRLDELETKKGK